jgi:hypothetical protein
VIAAPALACTNFVGKTTITGNASTASTVSTGLQCADDVGGPIVACNQAMTVSTGVGDARAHLGGTLQIQTAAAGAGTTCPNLTPPQVCHLNNSSSINYPSGNTGYDVNIINVGFSSHNSNPSAAQDCGTPDGFTNPLIKVATVSVAGGAGVLSGVAGANGYSASFSSITHTATVAVPGSPWVVNTGTQEAGMCISDTMGEDGIEVPFTIVS